MTNFKKLAMLCAALLATTSLAFATGCDLLIPNTSESTGTSESISNSESASASESAGTSESTSDSTSEVEPEPVIEDLGYGYSLVSGLEWGGAGEAVNPEDYEDELSVYTSATAFADQEEATANLILNLTKGSYLIKFELPEDAEGTLEVGDDADWLSLATSYDFSTWNHGNQALFVQYYEMVQSVDENDEPIVDEDNNPVMVKKYKAISVSYKVYQINELNLTEAQGTATLLSNVDTTVNFTVPTAGGYRISTSSPVINSAESYFVYAMEENEEFSITVSNTSLAENYEFDWKIEFIPAEEVEVGDKTVTANVNEDKEITFTSNATKAYKLEIETDSDNVILRYWDAEWEMFVFADSLIYEFDATKDVPVKFMVAYSSYDNTAAATLDVDVIISEVGATGDRAEDFEVVLGENTFVVMTAGRQAILKEDSWTDLSEGEYIISWDNTNVSVSLNGTAIASGVKFAYTPATDDDDNAIDPILTFTNSADATQTVNLTFKKYVPSVTGAESKTFENVDYAVVYFGRQPLAAFAFEFTATKTATYKFTLSSGAYVVQPAGMGVSTVDTLVATANNTYSLYVAFVDVIGGDGWGDQIPDIAVDGKVTFTITTAEADAVVGANSYAITHLNGNMWNPTAYVTFTATEAGNYTFAVSDTAVICKATYNPMYQVYETEEITTAITLAEGETITLAIILVTPTVDETGATYTMSDTVTLTIAKAE